jgi:hypothetical protein
MEYRQFAGMRIKEPIMSDRFPTLRERLQQANPELAAELNLQWQIAMEEWLPAIKMSFDSANGFPHLRNIEWHLDELFDTLHSYNPSAGVLAMRPIEIYMLLASILFHDLGRANLEGEHGEDTQRDLERDFRDLGIRNREVAHSLAAICASHSKDPYKWKETEHQLKLVDVVIDPYGEVRQRMIAALLTLADHMDCDHLRTIPGYIRENKKIVGGFRNEIRGVYADPATQVIRTALVARNWETNENKSIPDKMKYVLSADEGSKKYISWLHQMAIALEIPESETEIRENLEKKFAPKKGISRKQIAGCKNIVGYRNKLDEWFVDAKGNPLFDFTEQLLAWNIIRVHEEEKGEPLKKPPKTLLAIILGDLRENRAALFSVRDTLASVGLPLATWLIDIDERLYTPDWRETYEPLFHNQYLLEVAKSMWELSRRVIGNSEFSYRELASQIGDHDVVKVHRAVRRLSILTTSKSKGDEKEKCDLCSRPIWAGETSWKWRVKGRDSGEGSGCKFFSLSGLRTLLTDTKRKTHLSQPNYTGEFRGFL